MSKKARKLYIYGAVLIVVALVSTSFGIMISATSPNIPTVIEPGSMVGDATYIIFKDDANMTYAKNGSSGAIELKDANSKAVIQTVLDEMTGGGKLLIRSGNYSDTNGQSFLWVNNSGTIIEGMGNSTVFTSMSIYIIKPFCQVRSMVLYGNGHTPGLIEIQLDGNYFIIENVVTKLKKGSPLDPSDSMAGFVIEAANHIIEGGIFRNCIALNNEGFGWYFNGGGSPKLIRNLLISNCMAIGSGQYDRTNAWSAGFTLAEANDLENVLVENCISDGAWMNGFGAEGATTKRNVQIINSIATNSGLNGDPTACGFEIEPGMMVVGSTATNNPVGFWLPNTVVGNASLIDCVDENSTVGLKVDDNAGTIYIDGFVTRDSRGYGIDFTGGSGHIKAKNVQIINPAGVANIANRFGSGQSIDNVSLQFYIETATPIQYPFAVQNGFDIDLSGTINHRGSGVALSLNAVNRLIVHDLIINTGGGIGVYVNNQNENVSFQNVQIRNITGGGGVAVGIQIVTNGTTIVDRSTVRMTGVVVQYSGFVYFLDNWGYASVTGAVTTIAVNHTLYTMPTSVVVTTNNTGCGDYAVTSITLTQFVITFTVQPGANEWRFYWYAEV